MRKFYLDIFLMILFLLVMSFHFIPKSFHEIFGLILPLAMIGHFIWNWKAFKNQKKRLTKIIDVALILCLIVVTFSGICISNFIFRGMIDIELQRNITIHQLHVSIPFVMMILIGLHLGFNWQSIRQRFKNLIGLNVPSILNKILIVIMVSIGIYGSFLNKIGDRLMMKHIFFTDAVNLPFELFLLLMIGIFSIYVLIGYLIYNRADEYSVLDGTTEIKPCVFFNARYLEKITIPASVEKIGNAAFFGTPICEFSLPNKLDINKVLIKCRIKTGLEYN